MKFKASISCSSCKGTGLYVGLAERNGAAVVCRVCRGSGEEIIELDYEPFSKRRRATGITRVFECNPGFCVSSEEKFGGVTFETWEKSGFPKRGAEMRSLVCPCWWYQTADYKRKPEWDECEIAGSFKECPNFSTKEACWKRFDKEKL